MILYLLFKVTMNALFMTSITKLKYGARKSAVIIVAFNILIWLLNYAVYRLFGTEILNYFFPFTASIPALIGFMFVSKYKGLQVLFSLLTVSIFGTLTSFIGVLPSIYVSNKLILRLALELICFILCLIFIFKVFRKPYFRILETLDRGWGFLCSVPSLMIAIIYLLQYYPTSLKNQPGNVPVVFLVFGLAFAFYSIVYRNFESICQYYQLKQDRKILSVQTEMYKKEYEAMMEHIDSSKIYRHDMKHHLGAINTFLSDSNISEAQKYIRKLDGNLNDTVVEQYCDNYIVNVILSSYINKAKSEQIEVNCEANIPENLSIDNIELGLIFANALDNAINACKKIENSYERSITIACKEHFDQIFIRISNPFVGEVLFDGEYPVSKSADHGIGTRSIAAIAQKYGGVFSFVAQDHVFKTTVALKY